MSLRKNGIRTGVIALFCLAAGGCGVYEPGNKETEAVQESGPAWKRLAETKEDITFDWYINYSWFATEWGGNVVSDTITEEKLAVILGTEGDGLAAGTIADCDYRVRIPMAHGVDSLNVAAASAVAFWELRKREREEL